MSRFFVSSEDIKDGAVTIYGDDAFHISRSLRMAVGEEITVADGEGCEYTATLCEFSSDRVCARITEKRQSLAEPSVGITLYQAYPKGDKLEFIVQKSVELGVMRIVPFESERCIKRPKTDKIEKHTARLNKIAEEAAKQCGRGKLPTVSEPVTYEKMLAEAKNADLVLFCYEGGGTVSLKNVLENNKNAKSIAVVIGSEGGFSEKEAEAALRSGFSMCSLGTRILRCETAPLFALSSLIYFFDL